VAQPIVEVTPRRVFPLPRWFAILQALAVSGIPTQVVIGAALFFTTDLAVLDSTGLHITLEFMATLMFLDTALIALLIRVFLELSGENSRSIFLGTRPVLGEMVRGLLFVPVVFIGVTLVVLTLRALIPGLKTVDVNPLAQYMQSPLDAAIFAFVVVLGAGIKEELQRAFILRRFEQGLGGVRLGLIITTVAFGVLHITQGVDAAIGIGLLGLFWGVLIIKRRSAVMSMTNHAAFDAAQVVQYYLAKSFGL
jgi:membrane protease YdiL (CAAX protease family)